MLLKVTGGIRILKPMIITVAIAKAVPGALSAGLAYYTVLTYNPQGAKWSNVASLLKTADIVALQEVGSDPDHLKPLPAKRKLDEIRCNKEGGGTVDLEVRAYQ